MHYLFVIKHISIKFEKICSCIKSNGFFVEIFNHRKMFLYKY